MLRVRGAVLLALAFTPAFSARGQTAGLGSVSFPTSGAPTAQPAFLRGLALLHSFEYDDAADAFREAQRLDPSFAMAYWGEALTYDHPLWGEHDSTAARAALQASGWHGGGENRPRQDVGASAAYLAGAVEALYGEGHQARRATRRTRRRWRGVQRALSGRPRCRQRCHALALLAIRRPTADTTSARRCARRRSARRCSAAIRTHPGATPLPDPRL